MEPNNTCNGFHVVQPHQSPPSSRQSLSNIDHLNACDIPEFELTVALFFRDFFTSSSIKSLRDSLSKVLVHYPVLAGRLVRNESSERWEVDVGCEGSGVHFTESRADKSLSDWEDLRLCSMGLKKSWPCKTDSDVRQLPLLRIEAIRFCCGGLAMLVSFLHIVMDGSSLFSFLNSWSQVHCGLPMTPAPFFSEELIRARVSRVSTKMSSPQPPPHLVAERTQSNNVEESSSGLENFKLVTLRMDPTSIQACKLEVERGENFSHGRPTSFEAVSAMVWCAMLRATGIPHHLDATFLFPINIRAPQKRFRKLNIPENYIGNATQLCQVHAPNVGDLLRGDISLAASFIHLKKMDTDHSTVQDTLDWLELNPTGEMVKLVGWGRGVTSTSWASFPVYNIKFGQRLAYMALLMNEAVAAAWSFVAFMPAPPPPEKHLDQRKSMEIVISLSESHMQALFNDDKFARYFSEEEIKLWRNSTQQTTF